VLADRRATLSTATTFGDAGTTDTGHLAVTPCLPVARQSIPRFDLYATLGIGPSADAVEIEAAYRRLVDGRGDAAGRPSDRDVVRARLARHWLTDPELRSRYDASRSRAAARAAARTASAAAATIDADDPAATIPWPAADLARQPAAIEWSTTPSEPSEQAAPRRRRVPAGVLGGGVLVVGAVVAVYLVFSSFGTTNVAVNGTPTPPAASVLAPSPSPAPSPTFAATVPPTVEPTVPGPTGIPTTVLQQGAWDTLEVLRAAAAAGDLEAAQSMLGGSAPALRASGLRQAVLPEIAVGDITVAVGGGTYVAHVDQFRLTSTDGATWTFDWDDLPLAAYRSMSSEPVHDLWWSESDGQHHLYLRVAVASLSRESLRIRVVWSYDPARPEDATYFKRSELILGDLSFDGSPPLLLESPRFPMVGVTTMTVGGRFASDAPLPEQISIGITITNPRTVGGDDRANETSFVLAIR
jgi:hypothetical protein